VTLSSHPSEPIDHQHAKQCEKLAYQLASGRISFLEFANNVTLVIMSASHSAMQQCLSFIPPAYRSQYAEYLRNTLEPVDFMPCPKPFLAGTVSTGATEQKKTELRPKYVRLYQLAKEISSSGESRPNRR
jgi:hypothetical protein